MTKLDLKTIILLDNCYTMDLFWNSDLVENTTKYGNMTTVQGNDSILAVTHNETVPRYKQDKWFSTYAIINNLIQKY